MKFLAQFFFVWKPVMYDNVSSVWSSEPLPWTYTWQVCPYYKVKKEKKWTKSSLTGDNIERLPSKSNLSISLPAY